MVHSSATNTTNLIILFLLCALEQFEYQGINRLLLAVSEEYEDSGRTQTKLNEIKVSWREKLEFNFNTDGLGVGLN